MSAKQLFRNNVNEAGPDDPTGPVPSRPPLKLTGRMRRSPLHQPGSEMGEEDLPPEDLPSDVQRMTGREPRSQFNPKELSQLKDIMILILANLAHSDLDAQIGQALMAGRELDPGQLQHILDEARNIQVPDSHGQLMQKIFSRLNQ